MDAVSVLELIVIFTLTILVVASPTLMVRARKRRQAELKEAQDLVKHFEELLASAKKQAK